MKSFYASVECVERHFDPLTTNLVVAASSRTEKTICLAVSPSLKAHGISGRARLFEVVQRVKEVNNKRLAAAIRSGHAHKGEDGKYHFVSSSFDAPTLEKDPSLELAYYVAPPRLLLYEEYSTKVYSIYLKYIGTNMYLAKVAMDIVAKHVPADKDGVRIAELDEMKYRELLWCHRPLTDFWRIGRGYSTKLEAMGLFTMGDVARFSMMPYGEEMLYKTFGINAELLVDHAWGWEPTTIEYIKKYRPSTNSLSSGQVLKEPYDYDKARLIVKEMTELLVLDLVRKGLVTKQITLTINYDRESLTVLKRGKTVKDTVYAVKKTGKPYEGKVGTDFYGRPSPRHAHGTGNIERYTNSTKKIMRTMMELFTRIIDPDLLVRRVNVCACNLIRERDIPAEGPEQLSLFFDYDTVKKEREAEKKDEEKERNIQRAMLDLQGRFGKNAVLKGMNLMEGATTKERNGQVGGHKAE